MKRIEEYDNYREFLSDFIADRKKRFAFFSNRYFCRKAGISSPSLCREVISGKRNLTEKTIAAFSRGMDLTERDTLFFRLLVRFNQSKTIDEQAIYLAELKQFRKKVTTSYIPADSFAYYEHWYHPAIRELASLLDWNDDYELLARSLEPQITPVAAKKSVDLLIKLGFLARQKDGRYKQTAPAIASGNNVTGVRSLNRQFGELGIAAIENIPVDDRYISSMTVGITRKTYKTLEKEIEAFKDRLRSIVEEQDEAEAVYNLNLHLFPLTRNRKHRKKQS